MASARRKVYEPTQVPGQFEQHWLRRELVEIAQEMKMLRDEIKALQDRVTALEPPVV